MNDLRILHDAWAEPDAPSYSSREQARTELLARATMRSRRRWTVRVAAMGGLVTALVAGIAMVAIVGGDRAPSSLPVASAAVLEAAAVAAEDEPFTAPRDDQWIYTPRQVLGRRPAVPSGEVATGRRWRLGLLRRGRQA